ncbi:cannabidiolic acid synthase-like [Olea europaea subsp. europaea]|uniref:Cannabidiolic acid synthase-like n=1 Tax=Olea europaea subsp. europaea TaxID=158383 RepID=A0A8S0UA54_OLEEU|nr:cannabidiolic acid synthase-like [Olea europaea subsp. europaea]
MSDTTPKPLVIVTPMHESQIRSVIYCAKENGLQIRVRSGGHDYEGLSYTSEVPFVILDLFNLRIAENSQTLGFPAGVCPTVGVGGHFSGGGYGALLRKYGLAADNVIDARLVDVNGRLLDRNSMGEDLFWAIREGGGASFGVILAWKIQLVDVPEKVTVFTINKTLDQNATTIVHQWQSVAHKFDKDLYISVFIRRVNSSQDGERTMLA